MAYAWLSTIQLPSLVREGLATLGTREVAGAEHNPIILGWAREVGLHAVYRADETPWCGLWMAVVAQRAGWPVVHGPLWARNWAHFGAASAEPSLGDVLAFTRPGGGGHVGLYIAEDTTSFHVLGGNQGDAVSIVRIARERMIAARRPIWRVAQPPSVKRYRVAAGGTLSINEA